MISNHDITRSYTRWGDGKHDDQIAKLAATMYMMLRGTPIMYYGEEIGMANNDPKRKEDVQDPQGRRGWPKEIGRDGERTPMQWTDGANAGFSLRANPGCRLRSNYKTHNVATETADPNSILNLYRRVIALRREESALARGQVYCGESAGSKCVRVCAADGRESILVALNMSDVGAEREAGFEGGRRCGSCEREGDAEYFGRRGDRS